MNGRDMMPACARIAAVDPAMADRMWNTTTDDDGRDLVDERMRGLIRAEVRQMKKEGAV